MYTGIWCFQRRYAKFSKKIFKKFVDVDRFFMMSTGLSSYYKYKPLNWIQFFQKFILSEF